MRVELIVEYDKNKITHIIPEFQFGDICYYVYQNSWSKYRVKESQIMGINFTNILSYILDNGRTVLEDGLFKDKKEAIEYCDYLNKKEKYLKK